MSIKRDNLEVLTDMIAGGLINYVLTMLIFGVSGKFALATTVVFFVISYMRKLVIRRMFRRNEEKRNV